VREERRRRGREPPLHSVKREGGCGLDDALTPVCTCGWRGAAVEGWRDDQFLQLVAQDGSSTATGPSSRPATSAPTRPSGLM
jgi:hypothetical protein